MKKKKFIKYILIFIIITFIFTYILSKSGYYEYALQAKKNLTAEEMRQFEKDIKEGRDVDITDYLKSKDVDYTNSLTRTTVSLSKGINDFLKEGIEVVFKILNKFLEN